MTKGQTLLPSAAKSEAVSTEMALHSQYSKHRCTSSAERSIWAVVGLPLAHQVLSLSALEHLQGANRSHTALIYFIAEQLEGV